MVILQHFWNCKIVRKSPPGRTEQQPPGISLSAQHCTARVLAGPHEHGRRQDRDPQLKPVSRSPRHGHMPVWFKQPEVARSSTVSDCVLGAGKE